LKDITNYIEEEKKESISQKVLFFISFNLKLIFRNLRKQKKSTTILVLGLVFSLSILFTASIWFHTSERIIADDYLETLDYEMYVQTFKIGGMKEIQPFVEQDNLTLQADLLYPTVALFNFEDKQPDYVWYPEDQQENMSNPLSLSAGFVVPSRAMERISKNFEIEGNATLKSGEIMISYTQAKELESIYKENIKPGYKLNVAITRRIPNTDEGEIYMHDYDIDETSFYNYTVAGIYKYIGHNSIIDKLLGGGTVSAGGVIVDSIFFPMEDLLPSDLTIMDNNAILPKLLVKTKAEELRKGGIAQMDDNLIALRDRIEIRFYHAFCKLLTQEIQNMTTEYSRIFGSTSLFVPTIVSAILLTILSSLMTIKKRKEEVAYLRSRGAVSIQIIGTFFGEFFIISIVAFLLSLGLGVIFAALMPAFSNEMGFDKELFFRYFQYLQMSPYEIEIFTVIVLGIYLGTTMFSVIKFVREGIQESLLVTRKGKQIIGTGIKIAGFILVFIGFIFMFIDYKRNLSEVYSYETKNVVGSAQTFILYLIVVFYICYFIAVNINLVLRKTEKIYRYLFKSDGFFIFKNIKRRRKSFTDITFFLVLISCLLTIVVSLRSTTMYNNTLENEYRRGSDLRIYSQIPLNIKDFENQLKSIEGIEETLGFYSTKALIGYQEVEVFGVQPLKYLQVGRWIDASFIGTDYETALIRLANDSSGVFLSKYSSTRLGFGVGQDLFITNFADGPLFLRFTVEAIIDSAPGLGAAHGEDPKMNRVTNEIAIVNKNILTDYLGIEEGRLFLASVSKGTDINQIISQIEEINPLVVINPEKINPNYIGYFITKYIPPVLTTLIISVIFLNVMGIIYVVLATDFTLNQRRRENAIFLALGGKQRRVRKLIVAEIGTFLLLSVSVSIVLGIILTCIALNFVKPLLLPREIVPLTLHLDFGALVLTCLSLVIAAMISIIPLLRRQTRYEIVHELRAIV